MDYKSLFRTLDRLLDDAKIAVLANTGKDGFPAVRWMSPAVVRGREGYLYAITSPNFAKTSDFELNPKVMWMVQSKSLDEIVSCKGIVSIIKDPGLHSMVQEAIGGKLGSFWKLNNDPSQVVVLETQIESIEYFKPSQGIKESATVDKVGNQ